MVANIGLNSEHNWWGSLVQCLGHRKALIGDRALKQNENRYIFHETLAIGVRWARIFITAEIRQSLCYIALLSITPNDYWQTTMKYSNSKPLHVNPFSTCNLGSISTFYGANSLRRFTIFYLHPRIYIFKVANSLCESLALDWCSSIFSSHIPINFYH